MVNSKGGKRYSRARRDDDSSRILLLKEGNEQVYAKVLKKLGDSRFKLKCFDGLERIGKVRGKMRKRKNCWVDVGDYVLVTTRNLENQHVVGELTELSTENDKADIIHLYNKDEVRLLKREPIYKFIEPREKVDGVIDELDSDSDLDCAFDFDEL